MARFPGALWKPIEARFLPGKRLVAHNRVNLHVAVSEAASLHAFFNQSGRPSSHFYVRKDGTVEQYVDTDYRAEADLDGNDATISVETQGGVTNAQGEPWTPEQVEALAQIYAWAVRTHGIALKIAESSHLGEPSKGLSWHRLGIDGAFPPLPSPLAGREQRGGGMRYSKSRGKVCPGDAKIMQIPVIFDRAVAILGGAQPVSRPIPAPAPAAPQIAVDGSWGPQTTRALQRVLGTPVDGVISGQYPNAVTRAIPACDFSTRGGSTVIRALQRRLGVTADGYIGPETVSALQRYLGTPVDGVVSRPRSLMVEALQRRLNTGRL